MFGKKAHFVLATSLASLFPLHADAETGAVTEAPKTPTQECRTSFASFTGKVRGNKVRMRALPSTESSVVRETSSGEMFAVVGEEKEFYLVQPPRGTKGYVFRTFILDNVVEGDRVNVRLHPDIESPIVGQLHSGEKISATICESNNKWLEITLPKSSHFCIAKEYVENVGPVEMVATLEARKEQGFHLLNAAFHFANAEIQKPFDEIALDQIHKKFSTLMDDFADLPEIIAKAKDANNAIEETYIQKKIAFLESKADRTVAVRDNDPALTQKLTQLGMRSEGMGETGSLASQTMGQGAVQHDAMITDKMLVWNSFEESLYHLWAATHEGKSIEEFYNEEATNAMVLSGIVEPFSRPVKNRPGDYMLRTDNLPVAFLYSTKVNLQEFVGKKVTLVSCPRPNNNFAFPAYYVLSVE